MPIQQEGRISASPLVAAVVMFGRERPQPGVLIEPQPAHAVDPADEAALIAFRNAVWCVAPLVDVPSLTFSVLAGQTSMLRTLMRPSLRGCSRR